MIRLFNVYYPIRTLILLAGEALIVWTSFLLGTILQFREDSYLVLNYEFGYYKILMVTAVVLLFSHWFDLYDPSGFDCSGFVWYVFAQHGVTLPRTVTGQYGAGKDADGGLIPGDLVFFSTVAPGASHVGISIGGDEFVHAPSSKGEVRVERLGSRYWAGRYVGARRIQ